MEVKNTVAQRLIQLLNMTTEQLRAQRIVSMGKSVPSDDTGTPSWQIPEKIRQEILEAELKSGEISK